MYRSVSFYFAEDLVNLRSLALRSLNLWVCRIGWLCFVRLLSNFAKVLEHL